MNRLRKLARLPWRVRLMTIEAAAWLLLVALAVQCLPFRWIVARCTTVIVGADAPAPGVFDRALVAQVSGAVQRAARHLPFKLLCLPQALAAKAMLHRRGIASTLHLGMAVADGNRRRLQAHAWLTVGDVGVVGMGASRGFTRLAGFGNEP